MLAKKNTTFLAQRQRTLLLMVQSVSNMIWIYLLFFFFSGWELSITFYSYDISFFFPWISWRLYSMSPDGHCVYNTAEEPWFGGNHHFIASSNQIFSLSLKVILPNHSRWLAANTNLRNNPGKEWSGPHSLCIPSKTWRLRETWRGVSQHMNDPGQFNYKE